jgi:hypothetical protein
MKKIKQLTIGYSKYILLFMAFCLLLDFFFYANVKTEPLVMVHKKTEQNFKGRPNVIYSLQTEQNQIYVSKEFALGMINKPLISYEISLLFNEVNAVFAPGNPDYKAIYSLRLFTGCIVPLVYVLLFFLFTFVFRKSLLVFQVFNLVFVLDIMYIIFF